jgi:CSLREA domain-containing protein
MKILIIEGYILYFIKRRKGCEKGLLCFFLYNLVNLNELFSITYLLVHRLVHGINNIHLYLYLRSFGMHVKKYSLITKVLSIVTASFLILAAVPVETAFAAADIIVTTRADQVITNGDCSLREAIINANADSAIHPDCAAGKGKDTILLRSGQTYKLYLGSLDITDSDGLIITIRNGDDPATINARGTSRVLYVKTSGGDLTLNSIIVRNGFSSFGSGIRFSSPGALTLVDSTISDNVATASGNCGAGIYSLTASSMTITRSSIANNSCTTNGADGGGILYKNTDENSSLIISNSTFYNNSAGPGSNGNGGGMDIEVGAGTIDFSTFSNNTISGNGGAAKFNSTYGFTISNSILANSNGLNDCWRTAGEIDSSTSLIENNAPLGTGACDSPGFSADPGLGVYRDNGGPTFTISITADSFAYNQAGVCSGEDQRGETRPQYSFCDLGAFELTPSDSALIGTSTSVSCTSPITYGSDTSCQVTVTPASGDVSGGTVDWSTVDNGSFSASSCILADIGGGSASCSVNYTPNEVGDGTHWITAEYSGDTTYAGSLDTQGLIVDPIELTVSGVTAENKVYDGNTDATLNTAGAVLVGDVIGSEDVSLDTSLASGAFDTANVGSGKTVTASGFALTGADAGNYSLTQPTTTADITPKGLTVTADDQTRPAEQPDPTFTFSTDGFVSPDTFITDPTCDVPVTHNEQGTYDIVCSGGDAGANYAITYVAGTLTVTEPNQDPTDISLSNESVEENQPVGTLVGTFTTADPNPSDTFTYSFTCDIPGADDASFSIDADMLKTAEVFDYETKASYEICVQTEDGWGGFFTKDFTIAITDGKPVRVTLKSQGKYDGWVLESAETSDKGGSKNNKAKTLLVGDNAQDKQYRVILSFGTAGIPDNAVITKVILKVKKAGVAGTNPLVTHNGLVVDIKKNKFSTRPTLQLNDFQANASKAKVGKFPNKLYSGWYKAVLNKGAYPYINLTGKTQLRLRFLLDDNDDLSADILKLYSGNASLATRPQLIVTYYIP